MKNYGWILEWENWVNVANGYFLLIFSLVRLREQAKLTSALFYHNKEQ